MAIPHEDLELGTRIPVQRGAAALPAATPALGGERVVAVAVARPIRPPAPTTTDVALGAVALALDATRSVVAVGTLVGQQTLDRLPVPSFVRAGVRRAGLTLGRTGRLRRDALRLQGAALLDAVVPEVVRAVLARL